MKLCRPTAAEVRTRRLYLSLSRYRDKVHNRHTGGYRARLPCIRQLECGTARRTARQLSGTCLRTYRRTTTGYPQYITRRAFHQLNASRLRKADRLKRILQRQRIGSLLRMAAQPCTTTGITHRSHRESTTRSRRIRAIGLLRRSRSPYRITGWNHTTLLHINTRPWKEVSARDTARDRRKELYQRILTTQRGCHGLIIPGPRIREVTNTRILRRRPQGTLRAPLPPSTIPPCLQEAHTVSRRCQNPHMNTQLPTTSKRPPPVRLSKNQTTT